MLRRTAVFLLPTLLLSGCVTYEVADRGGYYEVAEGYDANERPDRRFDDRYGGRYGDGWDDDPYFYGWRDDPYDRWFGSIHYGHGWGGSRWGWGGSRWGWGGSRWGWGGSRWGWGGSRWGWGGSRWHGGWGPSWAWGPSWGWGSSWGPGWGWAPGWGHGGHWVHRPVHPRPVPRPLEARPMPKPVVRSVGPEDRGPVIVGPSVSGEPLRPIGPPPRRMRWSEPVETRSEGRPMPKPRVIAAPVGATPYEDASPDIAPRTFDRRVETAPRFEEPPTRFAESAPRFEEPPRFEESAPRFEEPPPRFEEPPPRFEAPQREEPAVIREEMHVE